MGDFVYFLGYHVFKYRKKIVGENIGKSFPELSDSEKKITIKNFYKNFSDYLVETIKARSLSENELLYRVQHINRQVFIDAKKERKNIILLAGHVFNWEWITGLKVVVPQENCHPIYRKIQSEFWEDELKKVRDSFGNKSVEAGEFLKHILRNPNDGNSIYMVVGDQSPQDSLVRYGLSFLNQNTPVFLGYDKLAIKYDFIFVYCEMKKVKRGFYQVTYKRLLPENEKFVPYELVTSFFKHLENTIKRDPGNYLWSHRRWKNKDKIKYTNELD